jgi:hypothetical protein
MTTRQTTIQEQLWAMPVNERLAMLACSVIEQNNSPRGAPARLIEAAGQMATHLSIEDRFGIADQLRNWADQLEIERLTKEIIVAKQC